jgi:hypothetical protein
MRFADADGSPQNFGGYGRRVLLEAQTSGCSSADVPLMLGNIAHYRRWWQMEAVYRYDVVGVLWGRDPLDVFG